MAKKWKRFNGPSLPEVAASPPQTIQCVAAFRTLLHRCAAKFLQALAALVPFGRVQHMEYIIFVQFHAGEHLDPEADPVHIPLHRSRQFPQPGY